MPHTARFPVRHVAGALLLLLAGLPAAVAAEKEARPEPAAAGLAVSAEGVSSREPPGGGERPWRRLQAFAVQGAELREQGRLEAALEVLQQGHDEMLRLDHDGPRLQAYLDGLRLQAEYGMTLIELGRLSLGEEFIATARKTVDLAYARRDLEPWQAGASSEFVAAGLLGGEALEMGLAAFYAQRIGAPVPGLDARLASERMSEAYRRAETWVLRQALAHRDAATGRRSAQQRVAAIRLAMAQALLDAGRPRDAAAEFVAAAALSCTPDGPAGPHSCARATRGWAEAAGATGTAGEAASLQSRWHEALGFDASWSGGPPDP